MRSIKRAGEILERIRERFDGLIEELEERRDLCEEKSDAASDRDDDEMAARWSTRYDTIDSARNDLEEAMTSVDMVLEGLELYE